MTVASTLLLASIPILITLYAEKYKRADFEEFLTEDDDLMLPVKEIFDFVIVGGGTAGCLLANRLSEKFTVLLLEVGGNPPPLQSVPLLSMFTNSLPDINFLFKTTPQRNAKLATGGIILSSTGKMLGGTSSHNEGQYERGNPKDYDRWANVADDKSWQYKNLLPFFKKTEGYTGKRHFSPETHGRNGDFKTDGVPFSFFNERWEAAGRQLGYDLQDSNSFQTEGVTRIIFARRDGRRESSYTAFIKPIEGVRHTLTIHRYSAVSEIIFEDKKAVGVYYTRHGVPKVAFTKKEVIISAGTLISPLLLIKSGVGPEDELKKIQRTPVSILPVGFNLMDHLVISLPISFGKSAHSWNLATNLSFDDTENFIVNGKGPLAGTMAAMAGAFLKTRREGTGRDWPDIQLYLLISNLNESLATICVGMTAEEGRGRVMLNTSATSMEDNNLPITDLNYFDNDEDFEKAIDGIEMALKFVGTNAFKSFNAKFAPPDYKACSAFEYLSREYWKCYIRQNADTKSHIAGTCKMGLAIGDASAVVDSNLRVIGTHCLRVIDASVMPFVTNANTAIPTLVIAEKLAHQIIEEYDTDGRELTLTSKLTT